MLEIDTHRLCLIALGLPQLRTLALYGQATMEAQLGWRLSGQQLDADAQLAARELYALAQHHPNQIAFYTSWQVVLRQKQVCIGGARFKGAPDAFGEVELGYGLYASHRGCGYMREAARALCDWALLQPGVCSVIAYTDVDNVSSQHVLQYSGMQRVKRIDDGLLWRRSKEGA